MIVWQDQPSNPGLYLRRQDKRYTKPDSWQLKVVYKSKGKLWVKFTGGGCNPSLYGGQWYLIDNLPEEDLQ